MKEELRAKLNEDLLRHASWEDMRPHVIRGVVFVVQGLPLVDAAVALATDDRAIVEGWTADQTLRRPTQPEVARWAEEKTEFAALIIDPFVLVQEEQPEENHGRMGN